MSATKNVFLADKELSEWLRSFTHHDNFDKCLAFASAVFMDTGELSSEQLNGARRFKHILSTLADDEPQTTGQYPKSGLHHNLDIAPRIEIVKPKEQPKV